jgi:hypothetical protein
MSAGAERLLTGADSDMAEVRIVDSALPHAPATRSPPQRIRIGVNPSGGKRCWSTAVLAMV